MKKLVLASALLLSVGTIQAAESVRWDSASLSYQSVDLDGDKLTGFGVSGTKLVSDNVFIAGSYASVSDDIDVFGSKVDVDFNTLSIGLGYRHAISTTTDFFGIVSYQDMEVEASFQGNSEDDSENGYGLQAGLRSLVTAQLELSGSLSYVDIADESETGFNVSAMYHFTDQFSAGVGYGKSDDVDSLSLSAIIFF
ncbi:porin family protein [uncultured Paraglaciecola sp.]|uniref:porin family protein n=1 Tax=uncultured Paraglaciecola sp. TaxID=1765024 RepID=UPI00263107E0|nr:porin family protein [uncultured Paraglaciecola sp.]